MEWILIAVFAVMVSIVLARAAQRLRLSFKMRRLHQELDALECRSLAMRDQMQALLDELDYELADRDLHDFTNYSR